MNIQYEIKRVDDVSHILNNMKQDKWKKKKMDAGCMQQLNASTQNEQFLLNWKKVRPTAQSARSFQTNLVTRDTYVCK